MTAILIGDHLHLSAQNVGELRFLQDLMKKCAGRAIEPDAFEAGYQFRMRQDYNATAKGKRKMAKFKESFPEFFREPLDEETCRGV